MILDGIGAAEGLAMGPAVVVGELPSIQRTTVPREALQAEKERISRAVIRVKSELAAVMEHTAREFRGIIHAQLLFLEDPELAAEIEANLLQGMNAEWAVEEAVGKFVQLILQLENSYMKERAYDFQDFQRRLIAALMQLPTPGIQLTQPSIVIARDLPPSDTAGLDFSLVLGVVTEHGGPTSHTAIMARAAGFPAMVGVKGLLDSIKNGDLVVLHAAANEVIINPSGALRVHYEQKIEENRKRLAESRSGNELPAVTLDGREVALAANIGGIQDVDHALECNASGVGLFRTEVLYMQSNELPSEEKQYRAYREVVERMAPRPVIFRTLDIGGDKGLPYLQMPEEDNPFLGYRALRLCLDRPDLFRTQLRAILRAGQHGNYKMMFPMVATLEEFRRAKQFFLDTAEELGIGELPEVGIMVEIPSAALMAGVFAEEVDFFSIGSNDLIQYTMAADRGNESVGYLLSHIEPSILKLIAAVIDAAHSAGKRVGLCGEMAGDLSAIPVLLGLGLDEFSMSAPALAHARKLIRSLSSDDCRSLANQALGCRTAEEMRALLARTPV